MPTLLTVGIVFVLLILVSLTVQAGSLWLMCRLVRLKEVTFRRALLAIIVAAILSGVVSSQLGFGAERLAGNNLLLVLVVELIPSLLVSLAIIPAVLRVPFFRGLLAASGEFVLRVIYVVVFVLVVRATMAEAFMVPTGSMAPTILGYHKVVPCPKCGDVFEVNASIEAMQPEAIQNRVDTCVCPNCRNAVDLSTLTPRPEIRSGERILTVRRPLDRLFRPTRRLDLVVHHLPEPVRGERLSYVRRVFGMPGETVAIHGGNIYVSDEPKYDDAEIASEERAVRGMHVDDASALEQFEQGKFRIVRKPPALILALRRIVFDADRQSQNVPRRWSGPNWNEKAAGIFTTPQDKDESWLSYRHVLPQADVPDREALLSTFEAYNCPGDRMPPAENWTADLIVECEVEVAQSDGSLTFELGCGVDRFRTRWDLASGMCTLQRQADGKEEELASKPTAVAQPGTYRLRFANVDRRLTVWVNSTLVFGDGIEYSPSESAGPTRDDLQPARIGAKGAAVTVRHLQLWRDVYYTCNPGESDAAGEWNSGSEAWADPAGWESWRRSRVRTFFVQPGHYFLLGDNSPRSADSRVSGLVPEHLLHARPLLVYYPFARFRELH